MGTMGEEFSDGVDVCLNCGSYNLLVEFPSFLYINRELNEENVPRITSELEEFDEPPVVKCAECKVIL